MKINAAVLLEHRIKHAWSQEELAIVTGLSLRTIQRMEKDGTASLQSRKALAAALEIDISELDYDEDRSMKKYEYKTVELPFKIKWTSTSGQTPDLQSLLNAEGEQGWRLHQIITTASSNLGQTDRVIVILEREK